MAALIYDQISADENLHCVSRDENMPPESTVRVWVVDNREGFAARYLHACVTVMADEMLAIADAPQNGAAEATRSSRLAGLAR